MPVDINFSRRKLPVWPMRSGGSLTRHSRARRLGYRSAHASARAAIAVLKRCPDGQFRVELPLWLVSAPWWRCGRRVWISIRGRRLFITAKPCGARGEKRWSRRVRRVPINLARRSPTSRMPCGQKLSERHAHRCMRTPGLLASTARLEGVR